MTQRQMEFSLNAVTSNKWSGSTGKWSESDFFLDEL